MKKAFSMLLAAIMCISICVPSFADAQQPNSTDTLIITVKDREEYNALVDYLEEHNERVQQQWQEAMNQPGVSVEVPDDLTLDTFSTNAYVNAEVTRVYLNILIPSFTIVYTAAYTTTVNAYNATVIEEVRDINAHTTTSRNTLEIRDIMSRILDQGRTLAVNYSMVVGIYIEDEGYLSYRDLNEYVEFYYNGEGQVLKGA